MGILDLVRGATRDVSTLNTRIAALEAERAKIVATPPHTEDLVRWGLRRLDKAEENFRYLISQNFNDNAVKLWPAERFESDDGPNPLAVTMARSDRWLSPTPLGTAAHPDAVLFFLAPQIRKMLPELIESGFKSAKNGMRSAERKQKLAAIDKKIGDLHKERADLASELERAVKAVRGPGFDSAEVRLEAEAQAALEAGLVANLRDD